MGLTRKQQKWLEEYLICWNASEAARRAGYTGKPNVVGPRLLANVSIQVAISERLKNIAMSADEALARMAQIARGDIGDFIGLDEKKLKAHPQNHLIKTFNRRTLKLKDGSELIEVELGLYDAQRAKEHILKQHQLAAGKPTEIVEVNDARERLAHLITRHADAAGTDDDPAGDDAGGS